MGAGGYGLPKPETWGASFRLKDGAILFPDRQIRQRSVLGLNFAFYQVNTTELEWKLAVVPLEKLPSVLSRERDFTRVLRDADGEPLWTRQGTFQRAASEPLISALGLEVLASGNVAAADDDKEVLREIAWKPRGSRSASRPDVVRGYREGFPRPSDRQPRTDLFWRTRPDAETDKGPIHRPRGEPDGRENSCRKRPFLRSTRISRKSRMR